MQLLVPNITSGDSNNKKNAMLNEHRASRIRCKTCTHYSGLNIIKGHELLLTVCKKESSLNIYIYFI